MADVNGWIKLHRKLQDNPIIMKDSDHLAVWVYLLLNATHAEYPALFKGKKIMLKPGQLITGCISIGKQLSISESKVRRTLNDFINDGQIDRQTSNKNSLITVLNWELYQVFDGQNDIQVTDNRQTSDGQVTTNKNVKNIKNNKNEISNISASDESEPPKSSKPVKHKYGEYNNVLLTDDELQKLKTEYSDYQARIENLSSYVASTGKSYKSHYATIRNWARKDAEKKPVRKEMVPSWMQGEKQNYDFDALEKEFDTVTVKNDPALAERAEALQQRLKGNG